MCGKELRWCRRAFIEVCKSVRVCNIDSVFLIHHVPLEDEKEKQHMVCISPCGWSLQQPSCWFPSYRLIHYCYLPAISPPPGPERVMYEVLGLFWGHSRAGGQLTNMISLCVGLGNQVFFHLRLWKAELIEDTGKDVQLK